VVLTNAVASGLHYFTPLRLSSRRRSVAVAVAAASQIHANRLAVAELRYRRVTTRLLLRDKDAADAELQEYYSLLNLRTGSDLSPDSAAKATLKTAQSKYAALGFDLNSPEFAEAVEATIRGFQG
jgi:hypothetical protein